MDSLPDVFCYVPGTAHHSLHELMSVLRDSFWHPWVWKSMRDIDKTNKPQFRHKNIQLATIARQGFYLFVLFLVLVCSVLCKGAGQTYKSDHCVTRCIAKVKKNQSVCGMCTEKCLAR